MSKTVRITGTNNVFRSTAEAARALGVTPGAIVHHLKGRMPSVGGYRLEYAPTVAFRKADKYKPRKIIYDDAGKWFMGYVSLARVKGITPAKARSLILADPEGIYRNPRKKHNGDLFG